MARGDGTAGGAAVPEVVVFSAAGCCRAGRMDETE
jgi:hypothetical protein